MEASAGPLTSGEWAELQHPRGSIVLLYYSGPLPACITFWVRASAIVG